MQFSEEQNTVGVPDEGIQVPDQPSLSPEELPSGQPEGPAVRERLPVRV